MSTACALILLPLAPALAGCGLVHPVRTATKAVVKTTVWGVKTGVKGTAHLMKAGAKAVSAPFQSEPAPAPDALGPVSELPAGPTGNVPKTTITTGDGDDTIVL
jgi:hypothetical protein